MVYATVNIAITCSEGLKKDRLSKLESCNNYQTAEIELVDREKVEGLFASFLPEFVISLAAQQASGTQIKRAKIMCKSI